MQREYHWDMSHSVYYDNMNKLGTADGFYFSDGGEGSTFCHYEK